ncbi:hypothetical protein O181_066986 [Austropuccinia psidii MF-1]|uniref:Uncharacterized protein n=1 Tax=Austropuccinia psidii MF-1 TaxID=1389203 RepID=A0A9Q3EYQ4_9BASI|nr:hypothetical protein [Austropuccinia psidii MF-1]
MPINNQLLQGRQDLRKELKLFSLRWQELLLMTPQKSLKRGPTKTEDQMWKQKHHLGMKEEGQEDQVPFKEYLVVFQDFQGPVSKFLVKMVKRRRRILWKRKGLMVLKVFLLLWGHPKVLEGQL